MSVNGVRHRSVVEPMRRAKNWQKTSFFEMVTLALLSTLALMTTGLTSTPLGGCTARGLPDIAGHRRRPRRPERIRDRAGRPDLHPGARRKDQDRQGRRAAADTIRRPAVRGHGRSRTDRYRLRSGLRRLQPLRLLLLHGARPPEPPRAVQRRRGRRHRRAARAVQDILALDSCCMSAGSIRFGPDGKLYFAVGDNGYGPNAQDLSNPHGKILRINRDGSIPADNPFAGQPGKLGAIWAYGFRNPWRFQFDSATGRALRRRRRRLHLGGGQPHRQGRQLRLARARRRCARSGAPATSTPSTPIRMPARAPPSPAARSTGRHVPAGVPGGPLLRRLRQGVHQDGRPRRGRQHHRRPGLRRRRRAASST